jgi:hypothetical protein
MPHISAKRADAAIKECGEIADCLIPLPGGNVVRCCSMLLVLGAASAA